VLDPKESPRWIHDQLAQPQVLLMGRVTYEAMSAIIQNEAVEGARRMTDLPKVVFSKTLQEPLAGKNSRVVNGDLARGGCSPVASKRSRLSAGVRSRTRFRPR
jgi:hypothetical protein